MTFFLTEEAVLKWLETPAVYHTTGDELYELDEESFAFLRKCASASGCDSVQDEFTEYCMAEGILTTDKTSKRRPPLLKSPEPSLRYLELQITDRCNLACGHCYIGAGGSRALSADKVRKILQEFEELQGLRVLLTGGEPLLHPEFGVINEMLPEFSLRKVLFSNGLLLRKDILATLKVDEVQISIDGLEGAHDSLRGRGMFRKAMDAVLNCIGSGIDVSVATMVHSGNLDDFGQLEDLLRGLGIREWTVDVPCVSGRLKKSGEFYVEPAIGGKYLSYGYGSGLHSGAPGFGCGLHLMAVMPDGNAAKCTFYSDRSVGNVREGLGVCWSRIAPVRMDSLKCDCPHVEACRGGCRYRAECLGDALGRDFYRCALHGIME
jgi:radical SAM protein with 4Fe4S-binding SPASM domain